MEVKLIMLAISFFAMASIMIIVFLWLQKKRKQYIRKKEEELVGTLK